MQNNQPGISFIEILVILLLITTTLSLVVPRFVNRHSTASKRFFADVSSLVADTRFQAITSKKVHQILFDFDNHSIVVKQQQGADDNANQFQPLGDVGFATQQVIPQNFVMRNFFINGKDQIKLGFATHDAWIYLMPDGTCQATIINIADEQNDTRFSISINPFLSQVSYHDTFQQP